MYKENGRDKRAEEKEVANSLKRTFKCDCGKIIKRDSIQFGEEINCPVCEGGMVEVNDVED